MGDRTGGRRRKGEEKEGEVWGEDEEAEGASEREERERGGG